MIEFAGGAVGPGILVPEAGGDLKVAVEAGGHQELFELLGRLRQGIELTRMVSGRHQIIPGPLGGGGGEDRGGDLQEAVIGHGLAQGRHHLTAQHDVALYSGIPEVQVAVLESGGLIRLAAAVDRKGELMVAAPAQNLDFAGQDFDIPGGQLGILAVALPNDALYPDGGFLVDGFDELHHVFGLDHYLGGAIEIPEDDKGQISAHFPDIFHPADKGDLLPHVLDAELVTGVGAGLKHINISP